jgi:hypothetical protein
MKNIENAGRQHRIRENQLLPMLAGIVELCELHGIPFFAALHIRRAYEHDWPRDSVLHCAAIRKDASEAIVKVMACIWPEEAPRCAAVGMATDPENHDPNRESSLPRDDRCRQRLQNSRL